MTIDHPLILMLIGLGTVFAVLLLVIGMGNLLIHVVNKFFPEEVKQVKGGNNQVDPTVRQAIEIAIQKISNGKSAVKTIEKI
ncbi:MAG: OadG family protein [Paludibacteraceae bacterium]|nr:OadG family protein [Paludibacteraceae bacterium]